LKSGKQASLELHKGENVVFDNQFLNNVFTCLKVVTPLMVVLGLVDLDAKICNRIDT